MDGCKIVLVLFIQKQKTFRCKPDSLPQLLEHGLPMQMQEVVCCQQSFWRPHMPLQKLKPEYKSHKAMKLHVWLLSINTPTHQTVKSYLMPQSFETCKMLSSCLCDSKAKLT